MSNGSDEKRIEMLKFVEDIAKKAAGSLEPVKLDKKGKDNLNDPKTDNRLAYLVSALL